MNGLVDSVAPNEGCEVLGGELSDEEWDKNDNKNFAVTSILIKWGGHCKVSKGVKKFQKCYVTP